MPKQTSINYSRIAETKLSSQTKSSIFPKVGIHEHEKMPLWRLKKVKEATGDQMLLKILNILYLSNLFKYVKIYIYGYGNFQKVNDGHMVRHIWKK